MARSGEGASAAPPSSSAYEGGGEGVGGKFRKRPFRKTHTTPYNRPPTALRNPSWLSKLVVDPASKLIAASAQWFFAPLFRKRLPPPPSSPPPPPPPPESKQDFSVKHPEAALKAGAREAAVVDGEYFTHSTVGGSITQLEQLLKQKTFTRSEIDRLTELLYSRAVDLPVEDDVKRTETNTSKQVANFERQQQLVNSLGEKMNERYRSNGLNSTPGISTRVLEDDIASPAEVAKAYMGNQVSKGSPSLLGLRSRAAREDGALAIMSLSTKANAHVEVPENGFTTPRSRGRSAIYNMARTPYSRVNPAAFEGSGSRNYAHGAPFLPASSLKEPDEDLGSRKLALKRRSSVLDEDLGSIGPMRRMRQKQNLLSHKNSLAHGIGRISDAVQHPLSLNQNFPSNVERKHEGPKGVGENDGNSIPRTRYAHVPPKSSEMAARILEHLDKMTPKEKSAESKLIAAREKTPAKLTTEMLRGQALKSLEDTDYAKMFQSNQDGHKLEELSHNHSLGARVSAPAKEDRREANGLQKLDSQHDLSSPVENNHIMASVKGVLASNETFDPVGKSVAQHPQKKRAFMMSAHEDSLEFEDDMNFNGSATELSPEGRGNQETSVTNKNSASAEKLVPEKTAALPEIRTLPELISGKRSDLEIGNAANDVSKEDTNVIFPNSVASRTTSQVVELPPSASGLENSKQTIDEVTASSPLSVTEISGPKVFSWANEKPEIPSSSDGAGTGVTSVVTLGSVKVNDNNSQEAAKSNGKLDTMHFVALTSTAPAGISSIAPISSDNGPLAISASTFSSSPAPASTSFASQISNNISNLASSSGNISSTTTTSTSAALISSPVFSIAVSSSPVMPMFKFGASVDLLSSASSAASAEASIMKTKTEKEANSGSSSNLSFGNTPFAAVVNGSNIFGLNSIITSSTANSQSLGPSSSAGGGSMFSLQSSVAGSGNASVAQGMPNQFGSSASSSVFGTSGVASFTSSNTLPSSSTTATKMFGTGSGFGLSTSASSVETKTVDPDSGAISSIFSFGVNAPSSSSIASAISSNGGTAPTFSFGVSSSATSSVTNTSSSGGGSTPIFNFGVNNAVSSSSGGSASIFGVSPLPSSSESNPASSSTAAPSIFGSSWQAPKSPPFGSTFNSSPSTGFSFGTGSSSFGSSNSASMVFGSSTAASSGSVFSFTTASATTASPPSLFNAPPAFGNSVPAFTAAAGNNVQMNMEDSMAEDPVQSSTPAVPVFGQQPVSPSPGGFMFGSAAPLQTAPFQFGGQQSQAAPFQFGGQQSQVAPQNPSPFQSSGSLEINAGGGFSLGSGGLGGDTSGRKIVKVNRNRHRKK
ncbi:hypothetical protein ACH5RR_019078 [Cinchona calisaya]|uniref:Nuclear pore complex protein n=1 Tax=Cinchona calisaya TaxID=153742 RepID=A0ABD2ZNM8_9GENT